MIDIVSRPSHPGNIFSPEGLTRTPTDRIDGLRDELVVEWQGDVPLIEKGIISYVERTRRVTRHSSFEHLFWDNDGQYLLGRVTFTVDVGRLASLAFWFSLVAFDAPFATREAAGLCPFLWHGHVESDLGSGALQRCEQGCLHVGTIDRGDTPRGLITIGW